LNDEFSNALVRGFPACLWGTLLSTAYTTPERGAGEDTTAFGANPICPAELGSTE